MGQGRVHQQEAFDMSQWYAWLNIMLLDKMVVFTLTTGEVLCNKDRLAYI